MRITRLAKDRLRLKMDFGELELKTVGDEDFFYIETDLGIIKIRLDVRVGDERVESVEIQPLKGVKLEGDSMVVLKR